jgi:hypothetical protein
MKKFKDFITEAGRCWTGYKPVKGKKAYSPDSCVKEAANAAQQAAIAINMKKKGVTPKNEEIELDENELKNPDGGMSRKGIAAYRAANPGSKLSMAVTTEPSKLKPDSKAANRRKSFCARMGGMKKKLTSAKTANDPDSRINKSLRKWNC